MDDITIRGVTAYVRLVNDGTFWVISEQEEPPGYRWISRHSGAWINCCTYRDCGYDTESLAAEAAARLADAPKKPRYHVPMW